VSTSAAPLEWLLSPAAIDTGLDRKMLAGLLLELARNVDANVGLEPTGITPFDPRLEQLRTLLLGREIELSRHFSEVLDDPEQLAIAVSRVLPAAIAQAAARDERLGQVLAPALGSSVRRDPATLVDILHPLIGPAIGKSIDATFQSLNETLKHSLSWRGMKWRWEAWRTGTSFAEVVLKHTLVYRVEHVFLIHRHTGLLIAHAASPDATSQDPQLVSSMLAAIQDFVRDSFAEQQGLDSLRLGELRVWSEPGPFATLVAVIRGNPPENLHETFRSVLARIHAERPEALENFDGDSSGFADVEAALTDCVQLKQEAARSQRGFAWLLIAVAGIALLGLAATWGYQRWHDGRLWDDFLARLRAQPGIVVTEIGERDGKWLVGGLRDPLAVDPQLVLREASIDPVRVVSRWQPYQSLDPPFVLKRAQEALAPPATVTLTLEGDRIVAAGSAPSAWMQRARASSRLLPAGVSEVDLSQVRDLDEADDRLWADYVARLRAAPGIVITETGKRDGNWLIRGLRDPLAVDPQMVLRETAIDPVRVVAHWEPYQSLDPQFVLERVQAALAPPPTVSFSVVDGRIVAAGTAPMTWIQRARAASRMLPAGAPAVDLSQVRDVNEGMLGTLRAAIQSKEVRFEYKNPLPSPGQEAVLDQLAAELKELAALSSTLRVTTRVTLTGHSDLTGTGLYNLALSLARAEAVRTLLKQRGVDPDLLAVRSAGTLEPRDLGDTETARSANRRVSFTVGIDE
jgi:outer membrane protein OmpA-like peptidoglycan-associated protein